MRGTVEYREGVFGVGEEAEAARDGFVLVERAGCGEAVAEEGGSGEEGGCWGYGWWRGDVGVCGVVGIVGWRWRGGGGGCGGGEFFKAEGGLEEGFEVGGGCVCGLGGRHSWCMCEDDPTAKRAD